MMGGMGRHRLPLDERVVRVQLYLPRAAVLELQRMRIDRSAPQAARRIILDYLSLAERKRAAES